MNKQFLLIAAVAVLGTAVAACTSAPQQQGGDETAAPVAETFNEARFPQQGVDVAAFSGGKFLLPFNDYSTYGVLWNNLPLNSIARFRAVEENSTLHREVGRKKPPALYFARGAH